MAKYPDGSVKYIIDGSVPPDDEEFSFLGEDEDISDWGNQINLVFENGEMINSEVEDEEGYGKVISTYIGIKNSAGKIVGMIGCDIGVDNILSYVNHKILRIGFISIFLALLGCLLIFFVTRYLFGSMSKISDAMESIAKGKADLTARIPEVHGVELNTLVKNCNGVIESLANLISKLQQECADLAETSRQLGANMGIQVSGINSIVEKIESVDTGIKTQAEYANEISENVSSVEE